MDVTPDFQQWLESLDEADICAADEAIERDIANLERRRFLLAQALVLKRDWRALFTPDASEASVSQNGQSPVSEGDISEGEPAERDLASRVLRGAHLPQPRSRDL
jgi:hypothetical protein